MQTSLSVISLETKLTHCIAKDQPDTSVQQMHSALNRPHEIQHRSRFSKRLIVNFLCRIFNEHACFMCQFLEAKGYFSLRACIAHRAARPVKSFVGRQKPKERLSFFPRTGKKTAYNSTKHHIKERSTVMDFSRNSHLV